MILYSTWHVEGIGTDQPDRGKARVGASWDGFRSEKKGCIMCQSSGCLAIVSAKKSATSCIIATSPSLPWRGRSVPR